jgi:hypothetical protein
MEEENFSATPLKNKKRMPKQLELTLLLVQAVLMMTTTLIGRQH